MTPRACSVHCLGNQAMGTGFTTVVQRAFYLLWAQEETHHKAVTYAFPQKSGKPLLKPLHFRRGGVAGNEKLLLCYMENHLQAGWDDIPTVISLVKQILAQDLAKWGRRQRMNRRMEVIMCLKWRICRHHRKGISDSSNLDYIVVHLWNENIALPVTITPVCYAEVEGGGFLLSVFLPRALMKAVQVHHW